MQYWKHTQRSQWKHYRCVQRSEWVRHTHKGSSVYDGRCQNENCARLLKQCVHLAAFDEIHWILTGQIRWSSLSSSYLAISVVLHSMEFIADMRRAECVHEASHCNGNVGLAVQAPILRAYCILYTSCILFKPNKLSVGQVKWQEDDKNVSSTMKIRLCTRLLHTNGRIRKRNLQHLWKLPKLRSFVPWLVNIADSNGLLDVISRITRRTNSFNSCYLANASFVRSHARARTVNKEK